MKKTKFAYVIIILQRGAGGQDQSIINNEEDEIMAFDFKNVYNKAFAEPGTKINKKLNKVIGGVSGYQEDGRPERVSATFGLSGV